MILYTMYDFLGDFSIGFVSLYNCDNFLNLSFRADLTGLLFLSLEIGKFQSFLIVN